MRLNLSIFLSVILLVYTSSSNAKPAPFFNNLFSEQKFNEPKTLNMDDIMMFSSPSGFIFNVFDDTIDGFRQDVEDVVDWFSDIVIYDLMQFEEELLMM